MTRFNNLAVSVSRSHRAMPLPWMVRAFAKACRRAQGKLLMSSPTVIDIQERACTPEKPKNGDIKILQYTEKSKFWKLFYALAYALTSILIMGVTKIVLTTRKYPAPSVIVIGQIICTLVILATLKRLRWITFPDFSSTIFYRIQPLPILYLGNAITGVGGTKALSLPMFTALRRFSILMTMVLEYFILDVRTSCGIQASVYIMIAGALVAAVNDFTVSVSGYTLVTLNNVFTSVKGVMIKKKLDTTEFGPYGILYYNALFMIVPAIMISYAIGDIDKALNYEGYKDTYFLVNLLLSWSMGFVLMWSMVECTNYNSALTTGVVGTIKNIAVTYAGMFIGGDYVFNAYNFFGLNLGVVGSIAYTYVSSRPQK